MSDSAYDPRARRQAVGAKRAPAAPPAGPVAGVSPVAWGSLAILERLGEDSFGESFRALDPALAREVTLRLRLTDHPGTDDVRQSRFLDEARRVAGVRHPNVISLHGAEWHDGRLGMWADRAPGETLETLLLREGALPASEVRRIGLDLCQALTAIHSVGVIHREVRASSVVREPDGRIVLLESGSLGDLARRHDENAIAGVADPLALALAPEQLLGQGVNLSTDVYGLGVLLYRLVSGRHPVEAESLLELTGHHTRREFEPLRDRRPALALDFVRVIERAIDPEPVLRYPNAVAMGRALSATFMAPPAEPVPEPARRRLQAPVATLMRGHSVLSSLAALALGCLIAVMLMAEPSPSRIAVPTSDEELPVPLPDGPPAPAAWLNRPARPAPRALAPAAETEPEEQWAYKPIPRTTSYGPALQRPARPAPPPARSATGPVAGATAVLRVLAQGPPMQVDAAAAADTFAVLTLTTQPDHAQVTIDGIAQRKLSNGSYPLEPGQHWIRVEKLGYEPQQMAPIDVRAGQKLSASLTLALQPPDSLRSP